VDLSIEFDCRNTVTTSSGVKGKFLSGKFYFEMKLTAPSIVIGCGVIAAAGTFANVLVNTIAGGLLQFRRIVSTMSAPANIGAFYNDVGVAVDLTARLAWIRKNAGNWNADAAANPATGANGVAMLPAVSFAPVACLADRQPGRCRPANLVPPYRKCSAIRVQQLDAVWSAAITTPGQCRP
jgi:hypothetical protein